MQPKVSMVMPCYNKVKWISGMLDSVIAQEWDNIELILVNDGSTDGTREVITDYEPRLSKRGYEVVIIDQENMGVAAAVRNGLLKITGEYVCQVDCDDELDPEYVSTMAGWLESNPQYDWTVCDFIHVDGTNKRLIPAFYVDYINLENDKLPECYLLYRMCLNITRYVVRVEYMHKYRLLDYFFVETRLTQEPQFFIPLALGKGKLKQIKLPLYYAMKNEGQLSHIKDFHEQNAFDKDHYRVCVKVLSSVADKQYEYFAAIAGIGYHRHTIWAARKYEVREKLYRNICIEALRFIDEVFEPHTYTEDERICHINLFLKAVEDNILSIQPKQIKAACNRVIAWGALGRRAKKVLPALEGTQYEPSELWDAAGDGKIIKKPDVRSLCEKDTVLVFPLDCTQIVDELNHTECTVIMYDEIINNLAKIRFPQFYDGSVKLIYRSY